MARKLLFVRGRSGKGVYFQVEVSGRETVCSVSCSLPKTQGKSGTEEFKHSLNRGKTSLDSDLFHDRWEFDSGLIHVSVKVDKNSTRFIMSEDENSQILCRSSYVISKSSMPIISSRISLFTIELFEPACNIQLCNFDSKRHTIIFGPHLFPSKLHTSESEATPQATSSLSSSAGMPGKVKAADTNTRKPIHVVPMQQRDIYGRRRWAGQIEKMDISSKSVQKVRRLAVSAKTYIPCVACIAYGSRCSELRPCSRCTKISKPCIRSVKLSKAETTPVDESKNSVEYPLTRTNIIIRMDPGPATDLIMRYMADIGWRKEHLTKLASVGVAVNQLLALSHHDRSGIGNALDTATTIATLSKTAMMGGSRPAALLVQTQGQDAVNGDELVWNAAHDTGFLVIIFDTATRRRREIIANPRLGALHGMHHEELLSRMASRDIPLPATPLDGLLATLFITVRDAFSTGAPAELYGRMCSGSRGILFCSRSVAAFDASGRLAEVAPHPAVLKVQSTIQAVRI
jgi:hypothetical protein